MMQSRSRFFEDTARLLQGVGDVAFSIGQHARTCMKGRMHNDAVSREELEAMRDMAVKAIDGQRALEEKINALEARLNKKAPSKKKS